MSFPRSWATGLVSLLVMQAAECPGAGDCYTVQYSTVQYSTVQCPGAGDCYTVQYSTVQYSTVQYSVRGLGTAIHGLDPELGHVISSRQLCSPLVRAVLILAGSHIKANDRSLHDITP